MIAAIHQPNYLPWSGYFHKMVKADVFVFLDNVQFTKNSYQNRAKIKGLRGEQWLTVPVKTSGSFGEMTNRIKVDNSQNWREKHLRTIRQNYSKAEFFGNYSGMVEKMYGEETELLAEMNEKIIVGLSKALGIETKFVRASELGAGGESTDLLIGICRKVGADTYLSGKGGKKYMDEGKFEEAGIGLEYTDFTQPRYRQRYGDFVENLSAIDLLFNEGENARKLLGGQ